MATTDRDFNDEKFLGELLKETGFMKGERVVYQSIDLSYDPLVINGVPSATATVTIQIRLPVEIADRILFDSK